MMIFRKPRKVDIQGIEVATIDEIPPIEDKVVVVVGDKDLAERLKVAYMTEEEAEEFLEELRKRMGRG